MKNSNVVLFPLKKRNPSKINTWQETFPKAVVREFGDFKSLKPHSRKPAKSRIEYMERFVRIHGLASAIPAFDTGEHYEIPDGVIGKWINSDPEIHAEQATAKNKELDGRWKPLVKMIKRWNREAGKPIKPAFLIEVMAQGLIDPPFSTYPDELINFFSAAQQGIDQDWPDPAGLGPPVSDQMDTAKRNPAKLKLREAEKIADRAMRAEKLGNTSEALSLWRQLFGSYFPVS